MIYSQEFLLLLASFFEHFHENVEIKKTNSVILESFFGLSIIKFEDRLQPVSTDLRIRNAIIFMES